MARRHGDRDRLAIYVSISSCLCPVEAHRTSSRRLVVVISRRKRCFRLSVSVLVCIGGWKTTRLTEEDKEVAKVTEETVAEEGIR